VSSVTTNLWQFAGGFYDSTTGLYKFGIRYYDPTLGRWTQQDPLGGSFFDPSTGNRYAYTNDDPTNLTDPTGADIWCPLSLVAALAVSVGSAGGVYATAAGIFSVAAPLFAAAGAFVFGAALLTGFFAAALVLPVVLAGHYACGWWGKS